MVFVLQTRDCLVCSWIYCWGYTVVKCFYCNKKVRWNNDYDTEDTYPDSDHLIVSMYQCDSCDSWYEVFHEKKDKQ